MSSSTNLPAADPELLRSGWVAAMGMDIVEQNSERVELQWKVDERHLQPFGLVHGGVLAGAVETACSIGATHRAGQGCWVAGMENQTSFLKPIREGVLRCVASPLHTGRQTQLWEAKIWDEQGRLVATGRLRLSALPKQAGGKP